jgi:osmotically-inducible protein OsmY
MILLERKDPMKNDVLLQHDVVAQLEHELHISDDALGVEVHNGIVKLAGRVNDFATLRNVERVARHVDGVTTVVLDVDVIGLRNIICVA